MKQILPLLLCLLIAFSCKKDDEAINTITNTVQPTQAVTDLEFQETNFGEAKLANFIGVIKDINGVQIEGVQILIGNQSTFTNHQGVFILNDISVFEKFAFVKAIKDGYIIGSRTIAPTTNGSNAIEITLLKEDTTQTVSSGVASNVTLPNGVEIDFSGNFIDSNNNSYNGQVNVALNHLEPNQDDTFNQMPGMLFGKRIDGSASAMETYGMINVTLSATNGEALNIAPESPATLTFPLSPTTPNYTESAPLWSFNETLGYWIEEGTAIRSGNEYIATVNHFSWWNCGYGYKNINACLELTYDGNVMPDFKIKILNNENNETLYIDSTGNLGNLCGPVPSGKELSINIYANTDCNNELVQSFNLGPFNTDTDLNVNITNFPTNITSTIINANITNCNNEPITNGYAYLYNKYTNKAKIINIVDGSMSYTFTSCLNDNYSIVFKDNTNNQISESIELNIQGNTLDLNQISTCNDTGGVFQGDVYLKTQAEVNNFGLLGYTSINGKLVIGDVNVPFPNVPSPEITSLQHLNTLKSIEGNIIIAFTNLESLLGLDQITNINGHFYIEDNNLLNSLDALNNLNSIGLDFQIGSNHSLYSLNGLENLNSIGYNSPTFTNNTLLSNFCAIKELFSSGNYNLANITYNSYNPTVQDIINGNCSQ